MSNRKTSRERRAAIALLIICALIVGVIAASKLMNSPQAPTSTNEVSIEATSGTTIEKDTKKKKKSSAKKGDSSADAKVAVDGVRGSGIEDSETYEEYYNDSDYEDYAKGQKYRGGKKSGGKSKKSKAKTKSKSKGKSENGFAPLPSPLDLPLTK